MSFFLFFSKNRKRTLFLLFSIFKSNVRCSNWCVFLFILSLQIHLFWFHHHHFFTKFDHFLIFPIFFPSYVFLSLSSSHFYIFLVYFLFPFESRRLISCTNIDMFLQQNLGCARNKKYSQVLTPSQFEKGKFY